MAVLTLTDHLHEFGYVRVEWDDTGISVDHQSYRVYRRLAGDEWELLHQTTDVTPTYSFDDWIAPANTMMEYAVVEVTEVGSVQSEETKTPYTVVTTANDYWLINTANWVMNLRLRHVTSDDFEDEYEEETLNLIGRGRKKDQGTNYGVIGTLTAEFRDVAGGETGRQQQTALRSLKRTQESLYLRNPFGDVWKVALGKLSFDRTAGVGTRDFTTVTIPYEEVA